MSTIPIAMMLQGGLVDKADYSNYASIVASCYSIPAALKAGIFYGTSFDLDPGPGLPVPLMARKRHRLDPKI